ncbi:cupin domain-containing protein [Parasediminibacterium sp. JCM 36343]|uniref:cupin domain-containing protein n=1 Tax=Parasediminibacterium sp. JCM 36343 TaxID=3374279 RepID=UPI0039784B33
MITVQNLVTQYQMLPHPEGGYYKETYRSSGRFEQETRRKDFPEGRSYSTAIYFLLEQGQFSAFHRIKSDECWHFYGGGALHIYIVYPNAVLEVIKLSSNMLSGEVFQAVVPANCWFASEPAPNSSFSFVGCTVSPGFEFADFELAEAAKLCAEYPEHAQIISRLCRQ